MLSSLRSPRTKMIRLSFDMPSVATEIPVTGREFAVELAGAYLAGATGCIVHRLDHQSDILVELDFLHVGDCELVGYELALEIASLLHEAFREHAPSVVAQVVWVPSPAIKSRVMNI